VGWATTAYLTSLHRVTTTHNRHGGILPGKETSVEEAQRACETV